MKFLAHLRENPIHVILMMAFPSVVALAHFSGPETEIFKGQNLGIVVGLVLIFAIVALWALYRSNSQWPIAARLILIVFFLWWAWELGRIWIEGVGFNYLAFAPPIFVLLVLLKRPTTHGSTRLFAFLGLSIVAVAVLAYVGGLIGVLPNGFVGPEGGIPTRYPILSDLMGAETRWIGPFGSVNYTSAAGGLAVAAGLATSGVARWVSIAGGVWMLMLSQGDAALFATLIAVVVFLVWGRLGRRLGLSEVMRFGVVAVLGLAGAVAVAQFDGAFQVRTAIWRNFSTLWWESPVWGAGMNRVYAFINENVSTEGFAPYTHAHSVLLNGLTLYGVIWGLLFVVLLVSIGLFAYRAVPRVGSGPLAVIAYIFAAGLAETTYSGSSWSVYSAAVLAVLVVTAKTGPDSNTAPSSDYPEPSLKGGS